MVKRRLTDWLAFRVAREHARRTFERFMAATADANAVQRAVLRATLLRNADSDYGRTHRFVHTRGYDDYCRQVPVQRYEDLAPFIERVKQGDRSALFGWRERLHMFALTSGTTDAPKFIPVTRSFLMAYRRGWNVFGVKALMDHPGCFLRSIVQVSSPMDEFRSAGGIPCGAITGLMAATQKRLVRRYYAAPLCVSKIEDADARYYTIMRLAVPQDVAFMVAANPATQLKLVRTADRMRETLIRDIHDGTLTETLPIEQAVRERLRPRLVAQPETARRLSVLVDRHGALRPRDYWRLGFLANWLGGTMGLYRRDFEPWFGATPVRDIGLLASEGRMSVPLSDETPAGILEVTSHFYEFVPAREYGSPCPIILRSHEVEVGKAYFLLLTTASGLYRYDIGDCIRVVDRVGQAPVIEFLNRGAHVCSLAGEKLTERQCVLAIQRACRPREWMLRLFVIAPQWRDPPYYLLHAETQMIPAEAGVDFARDVDDALCEVNIEYAGKRKSGRLGPLRLNRVPEGCLATLDAAAAARGRSEQFKHRYLYTSPGEDAAFLPNAAGHPSMVGADRSGPVLGHKRRVDAGMSPDSL